MLLFLIVNDLLEDCQLSRLKFEETWEPERGLVITADGNFLRSVLGVSSAGWYAEIITPRTLATKADRDRGMQRAHVHHGST